MHGETLESRHSSGQKKIPLEWDTPAVVGHEAYLLLALSSVTVEVVGDLLQLLSSETVLGRVAGNRSA